MGWSSPQNSRLHPSVRVCLVVVAAPNSNCYHSPTDAAMPFRPSLIFGQTSFNYWLKSWNQLSPFVDAENILQIFSPQKWHPKNRWLRFAIIVAVLVHNPLLLGWVTFELLVKSSSSHVWSGGTLNRSTSKKIITISHHNPSNYRYLPINIHNKP